MSVNVESLHPAAGARSSAGAVERAVSQAAPQILGGVFVVSGAAGLIYESIWSRYLGLFLGHSAYAQVLVLSIFLGGMSAGAMLAGRRSERLRQPLLWYAGIELVAGLIGLAFHSIYTGVTAFSLGTVFPALVEMPGLLTVAKWTIAAALILPQSVLLGATFPLMSTGVVRHLPGRPGRTIASLYFANSIGAAVGVLLSGFWLIPAVGLPGTVLAAALLNIGVAAATYFVARALPRQRALAPVAAAAPAPSDALPVTRTTISRLLLAVAFGTALASFIYEIAWIRMLSLVLGSATHSFELMLSAFILGLALGALAVRSFVDRDALPLRILAQVQWAMGALALATLPVYVASFGWTADLLATFGRTPGGYTGFNLSRYALCLAVMLPSTFCAGMTLPLITKCLLSSGWGERSVGWVYSVNTLGSIAGVALAGLVLLPLLGVRSMLVLGATLDMALGVALVAASGATLRLGGRRALVWAATTALVVLAISATTRLDQVLLNSGVFRGGTLPAPDSRDVVYYQDGRTSSVGVMRMRNTDVLTLATNGKPDASLTADWFEEGEEPQALHADGATQVLLALTTLAHVPEARNAAVVGFGSGVSSHFLLGSTHLDRLTTIEIEPAMVEASRAFLPANRRAYEDPRSLVVIEDAKSFFAAAPEPFDLILSEPSNPWVSGVSSLFGGEFYAVVKQRLADDGIFGQWLQLYEIDDSLVLTVLAAVHEHFGDYQIYVVGNRDILIVAGKGARLPAPDWSVFAAPDVREELARFVPFTAETLEATRLLNRAALAPLFEVGYQPNSDFFPILDTGAEKARFLKAGATGFASLSEQRFNLTDPLVGALALGGETESPILDEARLSGRARAARLRAALESGDMGPLVASPEDSNYGYQLWQWATIVASDQPPADWRQWVLDTIAIEAGLHAGSAGVVDEEFYGRVHDYLRRHAAPDLAFAAVRFIEARARLDMEAVSVQADALLPEAREKRSWVPVSVLLDGAVMAKLLHGDVDGAREFRDALTRHTGRSRDDLRRLLVDAYIARPRALAEQVKLAAARDG
jgi:predicted membrane-bound spermidine synthase